TTRSTYPQHKLIIFSTNTTTTENYTLSLHDALPICRKYPSKNDNVVYTRRVRPRSGTRRQRLRRILLVGVAFLVTSASTFAILRSEEHTSELQSRGHLVCRLLLEKKNIIHGFPSLYC